jgi:hypothetical protein
MNIGTLRILMEEKLHEIRVRLGLEDYSQKSHTDTA